MAAPSTYRTPAGPELPPGKAFVDQVEGDVATLIVNGKAVEVPLSQVPGAKEGGSVDYSPGGQQADPKFRRSGDDQAERIRAKAYDFIVNNPNHPDAAKARAILSKLPKVQTSRDMGKELELSRGVQGEVEMHDLGEAPPTRDEELGIDSGLARPGIGTRAAAAAASPSVRRQLVRGYDETAHLGLGVKAFGGRDPSFSPEQAAQDEQDSPDARMLGAVAGAFTPWGAAGMLGKAGAKLAGALASKATGMLGKAVAGGAGGTAGAAGAGAAYGGGRALVEGGDPLAAAREEATNPINLALGGATGILGGAARGLREGHTQTGRDIRLAEKYGATPTPFGGAKGGIMDSPIMADLHGTDREVGNLSRRAAKSVLGGLDEEQAALSREYAASKGSAAAAGELEGIVRPDYVLDEANRLMAGEGLVAGERAAIQREVLDVLAKHPNGMPIDDFNDFRQKLGRIFGIGPGEANVPQLDELRRAAKTAVDETPMGPINERYHRGKEALRQKYDQLKLTPDTNRRVAEERVANLMARRAENQVTAGIQEPEVDAFLTQNPKYAPVFDAPSVLRAKERMTFGVHPEGGGLLRRLHPGHLLEKNLEPVGVGLYRMGMGAEDKGLSAALAARYLLNYGMLGGEE